MCLKLLNETCPKMFAFIVPGQVRRFTIEVEQNRTVLFWKKSEYPTCVTYNVLKDNTILAKNISTNTFVLSTRNFNCNNFGVQIVGVGNLLGKPVYGNGNYFILCFCCFFRRRSRVKFWYSFVLFCTRCK